MRYAVNGSPALSELGDELLVCDAEGQRVHRLSGAGRQRFEQVAAAGLVPLDADEVTAALETAGLIVPVGEPTDNVVGMSRRRALAVGAAAAAAGVVTVALPRAAAAQSEGPGPAPSTTTTTASTTTTAPPPAPSGANVGYSLVGDVNTLGILWTQGDYPTPFNYNYSVTVNGVATFSGTLSSVTDGSQFTVLGNLGEGGGRLVVISYVSLTSPARSTSRNVFTVDPD